MNPDEWRQRLIDTFLTAGPSLQVRRIVQDKELAFALYWERNCGGNLILSQALEVMLLDSLSILQGAGPIVQERQWKWYWMHVLEYVAIFRTLRASNVLCVNGYPSSALVFLRDTKDKLLYLSAAATGVSSTRNYLGFQGIGDDVPTTEDWDRVRKNRKEEEARITRVLVHDATDLEPHKRVIKFWFQVFHDEVHGGRLSGTFHNLKWFKAGGPLPVFPIHDDVLNSNYTNRLAEVGWMICRVLPLLQPEVGYYSDVWKERWRVLDDSFMRYNQTHIDTGAEGMVEHCSAIAYFIQQRYDFHPDKNCYVEV